mgnify:CR=1 FL=1
MSDKLHCDFCNQEIRREANIIQITNSDLSQERIALCDYDMGSVTSLIKWRKDARRIESLDAMSKIGDVEV